MKLRFLLVALAMAGCRHADPAPRNSVPVGLEIFTRHSRFVDARISPGGRYLAAIATDGGRRAVVFIDLRTRKLASTFRPSPESVGAVRWVSDSRAIVEMLTEEGTLAAPVATGEIYAIDPATSQGHMIFGYRANKAALYAAGSVLGRIRGDERRVMIETANFADPGDRILSVYRLDTSSGARTLVTASPMPGAGFLTDENGEPRIASASTENVENRFFYREVGGSWSALDKLKGLGPQSKPVGFVAETRTLNVVEPLEKGFGLFSVDIDSGARKLLSKNDWSPPSGYLLDDRTLQLVAVAYAPDLPDWDFLLPDHPLSRVLKGMLAAYPDRDVRILGTTDDQRTAVVFVYSDRDPGRFLLVDVQSMSAEEVAAERPWVKPEEMAETSAFHIRASDGTWIHGYLTQPLKPRGTPPPLVVIPHGGPHFVRDYWYADPEAQLLASKGFAVLKVNFRGSGGYGPRYQEAGYRHWGDRMIEDIIDATRHVVEKGAADPKRMCIYGGSFGAYAALQAAILAPDLYRCAIGYAGIYDLTLMDSEGDLSGSRMARGFVHRVLGEDKAALRQASPVYNVDKLRAKVMLIHGKKDQRAPIEHADRLREKLEGAGKAPVWLVEPREGHGFYDEDARLRMYTQLVAFLEENIR